MDDVNEFLKILDKKCSNEKNLIENQLISEEMSKKNISKKLTNQVKSLSKYYWDLHYILNFVQKIPNFKNKNIKLQILLQVIIRFKLNQ